MQRKFTLFISCYQPKLSFYIHWFILDKSSYHNKVSTYIFAGYTKKKYQEFAGLIFNKVTIASKDLFEYENNEREELVELNIKRNEFRVPAFIDDTNIRACHVGSGPINGGGKFADRRDRTEEGNDLQKAFYRLV